MEIGSPSLCSWTPHSLLPTEDNCLDLHFCVGSVKILTQLYTIKYLQKNSSNIFCFFYIYSNNIYYYGLKAGCIAIEGIETVNLSKVSWIALACSCAGGQLLGTGVFVHTSSIGRYMGMKSRCHLNISPDNPHRLTDGVNNYLIHCNSVSQTQSYLAVRLSRQFFVNC